LELRALLLGDIVGTPGRRAVQERLPALRTEEHADLVIANAENLAAGSGITPGFMEKLFRAGVDLATLGDHAYGKKEGLPLIERDARIVRPANYPDEALGRGLTFLELPGKATVALVQVQGRVFMGPSECPFKAVDRAIERAHAKTRVIFVDVHAEATSEKVALGWHLDGRVSCVFGTHTHVQTADERVLPQGTAFITDLGMTGPYESVIGRQIRPVLKKFMTNMPSHFEVAERDVRLSGAVVTVDPESGRATSIRRLHLPHEPAHAGGDA
jgi:metallophosphoesterase (TIGR00282 family)